MRKYMSIVVAFVFVLMTTLAFAAEWTGQIVQDANGTPWFSVGGKNIKIANVDKVKGWEGQTVTVSGSLNDAGDEVTVDSVAAATA